MERKKAPFARRYAAFLMAKDRFVCWRLCFLKKKTVILQAYKSERNGNG